MGFGVFWFLLYLSEKSSRQLGFFGAPGVCCSGHGPLGVTVESSITATYNIGVCPRREAALPRGTDGRCGQREARLWALFWPFCWDHVIAPITVGQLDKAQTPVARDWATHPT